MSPSTSPNTLKVSQSAHDEWLRQRAELANELLDAGQSLNPVPPPAAVTPAAVQRANGAAVQQRQEQQQNLEQELARQRQTFQQDLIRQRVAFEQELAGREAALKARHDKEWAVLRNAKDVQEATTKKLTEELAVQRVREREELQRWRQQAEAELAEACRLFEQERLQQQTALARHRDAELERLRQEREESDAYVRHAHAELETARQRHEEERRQARDANLAQMQTERAELEKLRGAWTEKFRREQLVLENGMQFFEQKLSRVSDELKSAKIGLQAVSISAASTVSSVPTNEGRMTLPFIRPAPAELPLGSP